MIRLSKANNIDEYISGAESHHRSLLKQMRSLIRKCAPEADEVISYGMPAFRLNKKVLVYFAAAKNHIGFYPTSSGVQFAKNKLDKYTHSKGAIQFPLDKSLPEKLIRDIVRFRIAEVKAKEASFFLPGLSAPAQRALKNAGINTLSALKKTDQDQLRSMHGIGPSTLKAIQAILNRK